MSWSQRNDVPSLAATASASSVETAKVNDIARGSIAPREVAGLPLKRAFVSKEKQLEKLRCRLEYEGTMKMRTSINVCCKKCDDDVVLL